MTTDELLKEGKRLIERMRNIGKNIETQNEKLDEAKRKMDIIDHGWKWKKIDQPEWFDNEELMSVFSDEWKERMKQGKFTLSEEEVVDEPTSEMPDWLKEWKGLIEQDTVKKAVQENKVYDIDRLFWNGWKLFGYDTYYIDYTTQKGENIKVGPCIKVKRKTDSNKFMGLTNEREYEVKFTFDWNLCALSLLCSSFNPYICEPVASSTVIMFDMLFGVKPELVKDLIETEIDRLIKEIDKLIDDGKKGNRDC